jgi:hypothetical protein
LQAKIIQRKRGDVGSVRFRSMRLSPRLRAGSDAYPGTSLRRNHDDQYRSIAKKLSDSNADSNSNSNSNAYSSASRRSTYRVRIIERRN